jgi:hypothetical protein
MAFQLSAFEYREAMKLFVLLDSRGVAAKDYLSAMTDEKRRERLSAALQIAVKCHKDGTDPLRVQKIVCWRDEHGKPGVMEAQLSQVS